MANAELKLDQCTLTFEDSGIVHLNINKGQVLPGERIEEIFETIHKHWDRKCVLLVTADEDATLSQEARDVASSDISDQVIADAIVTKNFSHTMTANFFVRYNLPSRPTEIFTTEEDARTWLINKLKEE